MIVTSHVVLGYRVKIEFAIDEDNIDAVLIRKENTYGAKIAIHMLVVSIKFSTNQLIAFQHLGVSGLTNLLAASVAVGHLKLKNGSANTMAELQLNVRAWTQRSFSAIRKHVVSTAEKSSFEYRTISFKHIGCRIKRLNVQTSLVQKMVSQVGHWFA